MLSSANARLAGDGRTRLSGPVRGRPTRRLRALGRLGVVAVSLLEVQVGVHRLEFGREGVDLVLLARGLRRNDLIEVFAQVGEIAEAVHDAHPECVARRLPVPEDLMSGREVGDPRRNLLKVFRQGLGAPARALHGNSCSGSRGTPTALCELIKQCQMITGGAPARNLKPWSRTTPGRTIRIMQGGLLFVLILRAGDGCACAAERIEGAKFVTGPTDDLGDEDDT